MDFLAGVFDEEAKGEFDDDGDDEDDNGDGVIGRSFGVDDFGDGLDEGADAGVEDDGGDGEGSHVFEAAVAVGMLLVGGFAGEFSTDDGDDAGEGIA